VVNLPLQITKSQTAHQQTITTQALELLTATALLNITQTEATSQQLASLKEETKLSNQPSH
tara:strand:- start:1334 stop:1516 length:183 start_codon:yes stop_codon:yes gene_type:complete